MRIVLAVTKTSAPMARLRPRTMSTSCGLKRLVARISSAAHSPFWLCIASSAGTHPSGPVPVTITFRAPSSYSLCTHAAGADPVSRSGESLASCSRLPERMSQRTRGFTERILRYSATRKRT